MLKNHKSAGARRVRQSIRALEARDAAVDACADITTLAELLAAGLGAPGPLDNEVVAHAGRMITRETEKVRAWIQS